MVTPELLDRQRAGDGRPYVAGRRRETRPPRRSVNEPEPGWGEAVARGSQLRVPALRPCV